MFDDLIGGDRQIEKKGKKKLLIGYRNIRGV